MDEETLEEMPVSVCGWVGVVHVHVCVHRCIHTQCTYWPALEASLS